MKNKNIIFILIFSFISFFFLSMVLYGQTSDNELIKKLENAVKKDIDNKKVDFNLVLDKEYGEGYTIDDLNGDGIKDIAGVFVPTPSSKNPTEDETNRINEIGRYLAIGFSDKKGNIELAFIQEALPCVWCGGVAFDYYIDAKDGMLNIGVQNGSRSRYYKSEKIRYEDPTFKLVSYTDGLADTFSYYYDESFNFDTGIGSRYLNYVGEDKKIQKIFSKYKNNEITVQFPLITARKAKTQINIDGKIDEKDWINSKVLTIKDKDYVVYKKENWDGEKDLSFSTSALWDKDYFYLYVQVVDDKLVFPKSASDMLKADHIEIWFDFASEVLNGAYLEMPEDDNGDLFRYKPDKDTFQLAFSVDEAKNQPINTFFYPQNYKKDDTLKSSFSKTKDGYIIEVKIPFSSLNPKFIDKEYFNKVNDFEYAKLKRLGVSVVVSDTDDSKNRKQDTLIATSQMEWGNPFTFGKSLLINEYLITPDYEPNPNY